MPEPHYQVTNFQIGIIKSLFEEQGYGFITPLGQDLKTDIFFHYRNSLSQQVKEKTMVIFQTTDSSRHVGKLEGVQVVNLSDVVDFSKLLQLYLRYGFAEIRRQIGTLTVEDLAKREPDHFLPEMIEHELFTTSGDHELLKIKRFIKVLKDQTALEPQLIQSCLMTLLERDVSLLKEVFFDVYKILREDAIIKTLGIDALDLYRSLNEKERDLHFKDLTLAERMTIRPLGAVDSDEEFDDLLDVLIAPGENPLENWMQIRDKIILADRFEPMLWLKEVTVIFPEVALRHHIRDYHKDVQSQFLKRLTVDQQIRIFPFSRITSQSEYQLLHSFLSHQKDPRSGLHAFQIAGLFLTPEFTIKCICDGFMLFEEADSVVISSAITEINEETRVRFIKILGWQKSLKLFSDTIAIDQYGTLKLILKAADFQKNYSNTLYESLDILPVVAFQLWEQGILAAPPAGKIAAFYFQVDQLAKADEILKKTIRLHEEIFAAGLAFYINEFNGQSQKIPLRLLRGIKQYQPALYEDAKLMVYRHSKDWIKVYLWLYGHTDLFDFIQYKAYFITLSAGDQKRFIKRCFFELKQGNTSLAVDDIIALRSASLDPENARLLADGGQTVDFTVYIVLQALTDLSANAVTKPEAMYKIISEQLRSPKELLVLTGFFDKCAGRLSVERIDHDEQQATYHLQTERGDIPRDTIYCEGRKAMLKGTQTPSPCEKTGFDFWWCRNGKCYGSCLKHHERWEDYTLLDFLEIAGIDYDQGQYEQFLGYINKVNKFLKHMTCRSCKQILKPSAGDKAGNFGFYRVGSLSCHNADCEKHGDLIYLSHCINGHCGGVIDSRESAKCRQKNAPQTNNGWYVCHECLACCTSEGIEKRRYILNHTGQQYNGAREGHRDRGIVCCPKCGTEMNIENASPDDYQRVLGWFLKNRSSSKFILNSGQRKDGKYWFVVQAPIWDAEKMGAFREKLYKYLAIGFNVPGILLNNDTFLIAEPYRKFTENTARLLTCSNCEYRIELVSDYERYYSMSKYHMYVQLPSLRNG